MFRISFNKDVKVAKVLSEGIDGLIWNLLFIRDPYEWEIPIMRNLKVDLLLAFVVGEDGDA